MAAAVPLATLKPSLRAYTYVDRVSRVPRTCVARLVPGCVHFAAGVSCSSVAHTKHCDQASLLMWQSTCSLCDALCCSACSMRGCRESLERPRTRCHLRAFGACPLKRVLHMRCKLRGSCVRWCRVALCTSIVGSARIGWLVEMPVVKS